MKYYIAYASNIATRQMKLRCRDFKYVGTTLLNNYALEFKTGLGKQAYATLTPFKGIRTPAVVYSISYEDEKSLDEYEDCSDGLYRKDDILITVNGKALMAALYLMPDNFDYGVPTPEYMQILREGYEEYGFNLVYLTEALERSNQRKTDI